MTRERTTWNRSEIAKAANLKVAADIYDMNQDHPQPKPDAYVIGGPSEFAEDVSPSNWESEYSGGQVKRNEIGMPEFRSETFNHPEKTASEEVLTKKAALCVAISRSILSKTASESLIEDQALDLMNLPDSSVMSMYTRLAAEQEEEDEDEDEGQEKQAAQDQEEEEEEGGQEKQAGKIPPQFLENIKEKKEEAAEKKEESKKEASEDQEEEDQGQQKQAAQDQISQLQQQAEQIQQQIAQLQQQQVSGQQVQSQAQQIAQCVQQAIAQGQDPAQAVAQLLQQPQQVAQQPQQVSQDSELIDSMLAQDQMDPTADMDIQLDTPSMDVGEVQMDQNDQVLQQLFASNQEAQDAEEAQEAQGQEKQAHAVRTASTRTVGTRPTAGVSRIGGAPISSSGSKSDLSSLWNSDPDVRGAFGIQNR